MLFRRLFFQGVFACLLSANLAIADQPTVSYIYPAGGQRGQTVAFHVGGHFLHGKAGFEMLGPGVQSGRSIKEVKTVWFEGPVIPMPASQRTENYPRDHAGEVKIAADAELGIRHWQVWTSQGATSRKKFVVGNLPEIVEKDIDGSPLPTQVELPITINGRVFPREDVDLWTFFANEGELVTCEVNAQRLGSPLEARLEIRDPQGKMVVEAMHGIGNDPRVRFRADRAGSYTVKIHDVNYGGLQDYVYRLTITNKPYVDRVFPLGGRRGTVLQFQASGQGLPQSPIEVQLPQEGQSHQHTLLIDGSETNPFRLQLDDFPEYVEGDNQPVKPVSAPAIFNGRIDSPGNMDQWKVHADKGEEIEISLQANQLGSPLDSVLVVLDSQGKEVSRAEDISGDSLVTLGSAAEIVYTLQVSDRFPFRGGEEFAYRLKVSKKPARVRDGEAYAASSESAQPDFQLKLGTDAVTVFRHPEAEPSDEKDKKIRDQQIRQAVVKVDVQRLGGFKDEIVLQIDGLPEGVTVTGEKIAEGKKSTQLKFTAASSAKIDVARIKIRAVAKIDDQEITRIAKIPSQDNSPVVDNVLLAVAMPTPFRYYNDYKSTYAARGAVYHRQFKLHRGGFAGPLTLRLADRQVRHLQGVHGPQLTVPDGATEFEYPIHLPPWMQMGRTSRSVIMLSGEITDHDGSKHTVSFSSGEQFDQIIVLVSPGELSVKCESPSVLVKPRGKVSLAVRVDKALSLGAFPTRLELVVPSHITGISAKPVILSPEKRNATLTVDFAETVSPINMPLRIRATTLDPRNPRVAETDLELAIASAE